MTKSENLFGEFRNFVTSRPPEEEFDPENGHDCALARFGKHKFGKKFCEAGFHTIVIDDGSELKFVTVGDGPFLTNAIIDSHTMGQLSEKLKGY